MIEGEGEDGRRNLWQFKEGIKTLPWIECPKCHEHLGLHGRIFTIDEQHNLTVSSPSGKGDSIVHPECGAHFFIRENKLVHC